MRKVRTRNLNKKLEVPKRVFPTGAHMETRKPAGISGKCRISSLRVPWGTGPDKAFPGGRSCESRCRCSRTSGDEGFQIAASVSLEKSALRGPARQDSAGGVVSGLFSLRRNSGAEYDFSKSLILSQQQIYVLMNIFILGHFSIYRPILTTVRRGPGHLKQPPVS